MHAQRPGADRRSDLSVRDLDPQRCPDTLPDGYAAFTQTSGEPQQCQGGTGHNSWYGDGQVNALKAITNDSGK